jgi:hypothetical protein
MLEDKTARDAAAKEARAYRAHMRAILSEEPKSADHIMFINDMTRFIIGQMVTGKTH